MSFSSQPALLKSWSRFSWDPLVVYCELGTVLGGRGEMKGRTEGEMSIRERIDLIFLPFCWRWAKDTCLFESKTETHSYCGPHDVKVQRHRLNRSCFSLDYALVGLSFISYVHKAEISFKFVFQEVFAFLNYRFIVLYVYECFAWMRVYHVHAWCPQKPVKGSRSLEQETETVVNLHAGTGNWTRSFG